MKALKSLFLVLLFSATCLQKAKAQYPDYVITAKGDSIACKISKSIIGTPMYKSAAMSSTEKIDPDVIKEYYVAAKNTLNLAVFKEIGKKAEFMTVLEAGKISLYALSYTRYSFAPGDDIAVSKTGAVTTTHYGPNSYQTTEWYVGKLSDDVTKVNISDWILPPGKRSKHVFGEMLKDNENIYNKFIADDQFSNDQVRNLIHLYNTGHPMELYSDYVIKKNRDTVFCDIEPATSNAPARYKPNPKDRFTKIDTSITQYFLVKDSSTYLLKTVPKNSRRQYVKVLIKGKINLYSYSMNNSADDSDASLFIEKQPGELVQIKHVFGHPDKNEKKAFADMVADEPELIEKVKDPLADFKSIFSYIVMYNNESGLEH